MNIDLPFPRREKLEFGLCFNFANGNSSVYMFIVNSSSTMNDDGVFE